MRHEKGAVEIRIRLLTWTTSEYLIAYGIRNTTAVVVCHFPSRNEARGQAATLAACIERENSQLLGIVSMFDAISVFHMGRFSWQTPDLPICSLRLLFLNYMPASIIYWQSWNADREANPGAGRPKVAGNEVTRPECRILVSIKAISKPSNQIIGHMRKNTGEYE